MSKYTFRERLHEAVTQQVQLLTDLIHAGEIAISDLPDLLRDKEGLRDYMDRSIMGVFWRNAPAYKMIIKQLESRFLGDTNFNITELEEAHLQAQETSQGNEKPLINILKNKITSLERELLDIYRAAQRNGWQIIK